ncbi:hypothetical protein [Microbulbifer sp. S227A]|uniref:hypothetical protein n=1 Tax=Microbulbifer sp. S227A TaxID=3415131 RepID=UPI003C7CD150
MPVVSDYTAILAYLDAEEYRWNATEDLGFPVFVSYSFHTAANLPSLGSLPYAANAVQVMSNAQKAAIRSAMTQFEAVSGIKFVETTGDAMITAHAVVGSGYGGWAYYPYVTDFSSSSGGYVIDVTRGDKLTGNNFGILLHELGHSVGLSHTHDGGRTLVSALDNFSHTVMSYNFASTPTDDLGPLDVQALRLIYGDPIDLTGWSYGFEGDVFKLHGSVRDDAIMGVEGRNILSGGAGDDIIIGRDGDDRLYGGAGDDVLRGMEGADWLFGKDGDDRLIGSVQDNVNYSDPGIHKLFGGAGNDILLGGDGNDLMQGGAGHDRLRGGFGRDRLEGGKGNDILIGGGGMDVFIFEPGRLGGTDKIRDFVYYSDSLDFAGADLSRDDFTLKGRAGGTHTLLRVDDGADIDFDIVFRNTPVQDVRNYLDGYHDFG